MKPAKGNVRAFGPEACWWKCRECGKWIAATDEHARLIWLEGCAHIERDGGDFAWAVAQNIVIGSWQGQLFSPDRLR